MTSQFEPPPTYTPPIKLGPSMPDQGTSKDAEMSRKIDDQLTKMMGRVQFSSIWIKWFIDLAAVMSSSGGGTGTIQHNSLAGLQGGGAGSYYHFSPSGVATQFLNGLGNWAGSVSTDYVNVVSATVPTNGIYLPAANTLGFSTNTTYAGCFDSSQRLLLGVSSALTDYIGTPNLQVVGTGSPSILLRKYSNANSFSALNFSKSRGASIGTDTVLQLSDGCGLIVASGYNGSSYTPVAQIYMRVASAGTISSTSLPGTIQMATTPNGSTALSARVLIDSQGNINLAASGVLATNATDGFTYIPSCAGTPTGVPTAYSGALPIVYDSTNNKLYVYNGAWKGVTLA